MDNKRIINYICTQQNNNIYTMKSLQDLTLSEILAYYEVSKNLDTEIEIAKFAFSLAFNSNILDLEPFKNLMDLNLVIKEEMSREYLRRTTENKFKDTDTDTDTQTETNN